MGRINLSDLYGDVPEGGREGTSSKLVQSRQLIQRTGNLQMLEEETNYPTALLQMLLGVPFGSSFSLKNSEKYFSTHLAHVPF